MRMRLPSARSFLVAILFPLLAAGPTIAIPGSSEPPGAESPEALVARLNNAQAKGDVAELINCLEPEGRAEVSGVLLAGTLMMVSFMDLGGAMAEGMAEAMTGEEPTPEQQAEIDKGKQEAATEAQAAKDRLSAVLKKHGLPDLLDEEAELPEQAPESLLAQVDQGALARDLMAVMEEIGDGESTGAPDEMPLSAAITDYRVDGDRATATAGDETVELVRVDGRWYLETPEEGSEPESVSVSE